MTVTYIEIRTDYKNRINRLLEFINKNLESDISSNSGSEIDFPQATFYKQTVANI